jgi:DNA-binding transcriptional LysR family regulator
MVWDDYEAFCGVARLGSFTAAARHLRRSKSAVSHAVQRLEATIGTRLLERSTRRIRLTENGDALFRRIRPLLQQMHDAHDQALANSAAITGTLRVATPYEFGAHHLGAVACDLLARHPRLDLQIDVQHDLINPFEAPYDVVFSMAETDLVASNVIARRVYTLERGLFAAPSLLVERGEPRGVADLAQLPLLATPSEREWRFGTGRRGGQRVAVDHPRLRSSSAEIRRQAALSGLGVARITATYCADEVRDGRLCRLLPEIACAPLPVYALFTGRRLMAPKVRALLDAFDDAAVR